MLSARASSSFAPAQLADAGTGRNVGGPSPTFRSWDLVHRGTRPWTLNAERRMHPFQRAKLVRDWRADASWLAIEAKIPKLEQVAISAVPHARNRHALADVGACLPAVKASIDGLVDVGVLVDDDPSHVIALTFYPTLVGDWDGLVVTVTEASGG